MDEAGSNGVTVERFRKSGVDQLVSIALYKR
jgi:hypothetical protein